MAGKKGKVRGYRAGLRDDLGVKVRSSWEANVARWLKWRVEKGEIAAWEYEPTTWVFPNVTRGPVCYTPDFLIRHLDGSEEYLEVKGRETSRDRSKWRRVRQFYPDIKLTIMGSEEYRDLCLEHGGISQWEHQERPLKPTGKSSEKPAIKKRAKG